MVIKWPEEKNTKIFFGFSELEMLEGKKKDCCRDLYDNCWQTTDWVLNFFVV